MRNFFECNRGCFGDEHTSRFLPIEQRDSTEYSRTVSFSERVRVSEIPSKETYTKRQKSALWYPEPSTGRNFNIMQLALCGIAKERNEDGDELGFGIQQTRSDSSFPVSAVLTEQESRRDSGQEVDPSEIAKIYHRCSAYSAVRAQMRALECELDAQDYMYEPAKHGKQKIILLEEPREC